ncbi:Clavaminate synthase-like protein [Trichodelitschia bisporula]|uniref:Clavaminate synthase-like protein n=1 Tax=Trichodelitschia bisporula TaxID=703511 RepID=A0A6G1HLQ3_9PEZI|nr:Clavaminate synthase-like protein [Trichodelitschia bisporula]
MSLPTISLVPFLTPTPSPTPAQLETASALRQACISYGFFHLTDHAIPLTFLSSLLSRTAEFFQTAPAAEKQALKRLPPPLGDNARGYQRLGENITGGQADWQEAIDFYRPWPAHLPPPTSDALLTGPNLYPHTPATLAELLREYVDRCLDLGAALVRAVALALDLTPEETASLHAATSESFWVLRMIGYPPLPPSSASSSSCGAHTDYGLLTLLLASPVPDSLLVQSRDGTWLPVTPVEGAFVVNIGDMLERLTNGEWKSTVHRVEHRGASYRVSCPFFFEPNFDARIEPLPTCVARTGGVAKYEAVEYGAHLVGKIRGNFYD